MNYFSRICVAILLLVSLAVCSLSVNAAPKNQDLPCVIEAISPDYENNELVVLGQSFSDGLSVPVVKLGGLELTINDSTETQIIASADLGAFEVGSYLVKVDPDVEGLRACDVMFGLAGQSIDSHGVYMVESTSALAQTTIIRMACFEGDVPISMGSMMVSEHDGCDYTVNNCLTHSPTPWVVFTDSGVRPGFALTYRGAITITPRAHLICHDVGKQSAIPGARYTATCNNNYGSNVWDCWPPN